MEILIVDDEMPARKQLRALLQDYNSIELSIEEAKSGEEALNFLKGRTFDVVFLDIQLQDMTGLEIAEEMVLRKYPSKIVFVTAFDEYALKAFDYAAVDYLLKPIDDQRFEKTLLRIEKEYREKGKKALENPISSVQRLLKEHLQEKHQSKKLTLEREDRLYVLDIEEVIYIETEEGNTKVVTSKGDFSSNFTLTEWETKLPDPPFFRIHRSFLVNLEKIEEVVYWFNNSLQIKVKERPDNLIPVSRSRSKSFKKKMNIQN
ncbi:LytR/AlgR family response regulator transcription factor [Isachenkonia alkalipeptolytica]|uniref:Stage 0 sporulation protein A homolog n=1 Tax=Isachenkonia alkalipeptolytica TaxID=2565777 RepID=A0AA44BCR0_9CLOT|nr:LytTR family DNA-binding domain-containing protein [Isachenkonia alkalipeptolytica]NBG87148.1 response regulator transcription factor [Isachenkonia alkalipeptolytica]